MKERKEIVIPDSIYKPLRPIISVCRIFCLLPFAIKKNGTEWWIVWSWRMLSITVFVIGIIVSYSMYGLSVNYQLEEIHKIRLGKFSSILISFTDVTTLVSTFLLCCFSSVLNFEHLREYFNNLTKVDMVIKFQLSTFESKRCTTLVLLSSMLTVLVLFTDLAVWSAVAMKNTSIFSYILHQIFFYFYYSFMVVTGVYYYLLIRCIYVRLKFLSYNLRKEYLRYKRKRKISEVSRIKFETSLLPQNFILNENNTESLQNTKISYSEGYESLVESSIALNKYYGLMLLVNMFGILLHLLVTPYDLYVEIAHQKYGFIILQMIWMIGHILRLLLIIEPCHQTEKQVKEMCFLICKLLNLKIEMDHREQLNNLLSQLSHCPIKFTAYDMVSINRQLITSIAGAVTTYLVILFQFSG